MKPATALRLVGQYARLTREIKLCGKQIGSALDKCRGLKGWRLETETNPGWPATEDFGGSPPFETPTDRSQTDQDTHLKEWYSMVDCGDDDRCWQSITPKHEAECPACYAAHLVIQRRKELRKSLAAVKGAMTRLGA
jgi:hypothetical protein